MLLVSYGKVQHGWARTQWFYLTTLTQALGKLNHYCHEKYGFYNGDVYIYLIFIKPSGACKSLS